MPDIIVNIAIICLLIPTIIFAYVLNKKLDVLRNSRNDLGRLIEAFNDATIRAESGIPKLRQAADSAGGQLKDQVEKAQILRDDLAFLIERAESSATKLEHTVRQVRSQTNKASISDTEAKISEIENMLTSTTQEDIMIDDTQTDAEKELLKALKALK